MLSESCLDRWDSEHRAMMDISSSTSHKQQVAKLGLNPGLVPLVRSSSLSWAVYSVLYSPICTSLKPRRQVCIWSALWRGGLESLKGALECGKALLSFFFHQTFWYWRLRHRWCSPGGLWGPVRVGGINKVIKCTILLTPEIDTNMYGFECPYTEPQTPVSSRLIVLSLSQCWISTYTEKVFLTVLAKSTFCSF